MEGALVLGHEGLLRVGVHEVPLSVPERVGLLLVGFPRDDRTRTCCGLACFLS